MLPFHFPILFFLSELIVIFLDSLLELRQSFVAFLHHLANCQTILKRHFLLHVGIFFLAFADSIHLLLLNTATLLPVFDFSITMLERLFRIPKHFLLFRLDSVELFVNGSIHSRLLGLFLFPATFNASRCLLPGSITCFARFRLLHFGFFLRGDWNLLCVVDRFLFRPPRQGRPTLDRGLWNLFTRSRLLLPRNLGSLFQSKFFKIFPIPSDPLQAKLFVLTDSIMVLIRVRIRGLGIIPVTVRVTTRIGRFGIISLVVTLFHIVSF